MASGSIPVRSRDAAESPTAASENQRGLRRPQEIAELLGAQWRARDPAAAAPATCPGGIRPPAAPLRLRLRLDAKNRLVGPRASRAHGLRGRARKQLPGS